MVVGRADSSRQRRRQSRRRSRRDVRTVEYEARVRARAFLEGELQPLAPILATAGCCVGTAVIRRNVAAGSFPQSSTLPAPERANVGKWALLEQGDSGGVCAHIFPGA